MKSTPRVPVDVPRVAVGYKYIYQKFLGFITTEGGRSTGPGVPYLSHYPNNYSNVYIIPVLCPQSISRYFSAFNVRDNHNRMEV